MKNFKNGPFYISNILFFINLIFRYGDKESKLSILLDGFAFSLIPIET